MIMVLMMTLVMVISMLAGLAPFVSSVNVFMVYMMLFSVRLDIRYMLMLRINLFSPE